jgi:hypothetical protein
MAECHSRPFSGYFAAGIGPSGSLPRGMWSLMHLSFSSRTVCLLPGTRPQCVINWYNSPTSYAYSTHTPYIPVSSSALRTFASSTQLWQQLLYVRAVLTCNCNESTLKFNIVWDRPQRIVHVCVLDLMLGWTSTEDALKLLQ